VNGLDDLAAAGAALLAGVVNAVAGGGTLISFPALVGLGVGAVPANVTNTVSLVPGYLAASWAQREDLRPQAQRARGLLVWSAAGGLAGAGLLIVIPGSAFRVAVPYLLLLSCGLLLAQGPVRALVVRRQAASASRAGAAAGPGAVAGAGVGAGTGAGAGAVAEPGAGAGAGASAGAAAVAGSTAAAGASLAMRLSVFAAAVYGGFFGAGLGILLLAVLGIFDDQPLIQTNALKQLLSFAVNVVAAVGFCFSGRVRWDLAPIMAVAALAGGALGGRLARVVDAGLLRLLVVVAGLAVAVSFWVA